MVRSSRTRTLWVNNLDRQMAESEAIRRAVGPDGGSAEIRSAERITDPETGKGVWEIVVAVSRRGSRRLAR